MKEKNRNTNDKPGTPKSIQYLFCIWYWYYLLQTCTWFYTNSIYHILQPSAQSRTNIRPAPSRALTLPSWLLESSLHGGVTSSRNRGGDLKRANSGPRRYSRCHLCLLGHREHLELGPDKIILNQVPIQFDEGCETNETVKATKCRNYLCFCVILANNHSKTFNITYNHCLNGAF